QPIIGIGVACFTGRVDRGAQRTSELGIALDQGREVIRRPVDVSRVRSKCGCRGYGLGSTERRAAQLNDTFCHCVAMLFQLAAKPVDHLVQRDEVRALDVPMRACLVSSARSIASARRALRMAIATALALDGRSLWV